MNHDETKRQLEETRDGYSEEAVWMRFLIDAFTGGGGFQGRIKQAPAGYWGSASEAYSTVAKLLSQSNVGPAGSYLDRYKREDQVKFAERAGVAYYLNYIKPTTLLKLSYFLRKPHLRTNLPDELKKWIAETGYDKQLRRRALTAAVLGWMPVLVDLPPQGQDLGLPYVSGLLPCHLLDYELDRDGAFKWAKILTPYTERETWSAPRVSIKRYTIWTREDFTYYEVRPSSNGQEIVSEPTAGAHPFKRVPIAVWRADVSIEDPIKAESWNADIAPVARRLFNLVSELDEVLRGSAFPVLIYPLAQTTPNATAEVGVENGLVIDPEQKNQPHYIEGGAESAGSLEARILSTVVEIYRMARVEYERPSGTQSSAQSKEQNFEQTNLAIVDFAEAMAVADRETLITVGNGLGLDERKLRAIECIPANDFSTEELQADIDQVTASLTIRLLGRRFKAEVLKRFVRRVLPHLDQAAQVDIDSEIDELSKEAAQEESAIGDDEEEAAE